MKKILIYIIILIGLIDSSCLFSNAISDIESENIKEEIQYELESAIESDILEILKDIGIDNFDLDNVYNISFASISRFFSDTLKDKLNLNLKTFFELLGVILISGIVSTLFSGDDKEDLIGIISMILITLSAINSVSVTLSAVISVLEASSKFMLAFIPLYTLIVSLSGNPAGALTYNTLVIGFAEIISTFITTNITDFLGVFYCLGISFSFNSSINISRIISAVNKGFSTILGLMASLFTGFLSLKSILSVSVDSLSVKGIRFLISSMIPIVGSSISEAYSSFLGSINVIKSSVAIVGILVIIIINTPIIIETMIYYISFCMLGYIADSVSAKRAGDILKCLSCGMRILLLVCIFEMFIMMISTGIILSVKNGG